MMNESPDAGWITFHDLAAPLVRRRGLLAAIAFGAVFTTGAITMLMPRPYEASAILATVGGSRGLSSLGSLAGAAAAFGGVGLGSGELNPTPDLISALLVSRKVLAAVGTMPIEGGSRSIADAIAGEAVAAPDIPNEMSRHIRTEIGARTGLVTLIVRLRDSALGRQVGEALIDQMRRTFIDASRAQARALRLAQEARVDSARRQLTRLDQEFRTFLRANRVIADFSQQSVERDRLQRDIDVARQVYLQATGDREAAVAKELQDTPAVVVVDPLPDQLPLRPRYLVIKLTLALVAGLLAGVMLIYLLETAGPPAVRTDG